MANVTVYSANAKNLNEKLLDRVVVAYTSGSVDVYVKNGFLYVRSEDGDLAAETFRMIRDQLDITL